MLPRSMVQGKSMHFLFPQSWWVKKVITMLHKMLTINNAMKDGGNMRIPTHGFFFRATEYDTITELNTAAKKRRHEIPCGSADG